MKWINDRSRLLEILYLVAEKVLRRIDTVIRVIGYDRIGWLLIIPEETSKKMIFGCKMCGQCILHSTGMTCPMTCPKNLRNGPCGGVHISGACEVIPEMICVWVEAYERAQKMRVYDQELLTIQLPLNHELEGSSAWINMLTKEDKNVPKAWADMSYIPLLEK